MTLLQQVAYKVRAAHALLRDAVTECQCGVECSDEVCRYHSIVTTARDVLGLVDRQFPGCDDCCIANCSLRVNGPTNRNVEIVPCPYPCGHRPTIQRPDYVDHGRQTWASKIPAGKCFRKRNGEMIYRRMSEGAVLHLGLDNEKVYGICQENGNVAALEFDTNVIPASG
ncbi:MAG: hypothetical protein ABFC88_12350 [Thermoguttaceae bacterium]